MNRLKEDLVNRYKNLLALTDLLEKKVTKFPEGGLKVSSRKDKTYYYYVPENDPSQAKLLKEDDDLIRQLAQKRYFLKVIRAAKKEMRSLKAAIDGFPDIIAEDIYLSLPKGRREMISPILRPDDEFVRAWQAAEYVHKGFKEGDPYYETMNKERVRSKSEMLIADHLKMAGIPYKYEYPVRINNVLYHPDFKILRVGDRKELYLEHCGMLDDKKYCNDLVTKLNDYAMNGIYIGNNLYLLFETDKYPLDMRVLDIMIDKCFR